LSALVAITGNGTIGATRGQFAGWPAELPLLSVAFGVVRFL
jgi:hypothetical protein